MLSLSVGNLTLGVPFLTGSGAAARGNNGSQLPALGRNNPRKPKECKNSIPVSTFYSIKLERQPNVLIDPSGTPRLTDFGLSLINEDDLFADTPVQGGRGSIRWQAPELLGLSKKTKDQNRRPTYKSDVYSLAMVVIEVMFPHPVRSPPLILPTIFRYLPGPTHLMGKITGR